MHLNWKKVLLRFINWVSSIFWAFLERYPLEHTFSKRHRTTGALFEPAVWRPSEVERILIDFVLHEAGVRGNGWSSVRGKLYGIRHLNIRNHLGDPLLGKLRLKQVLRGLKKLRGPGEGKHPVTLEIIRKIGQRLNFGKTDDELGLWVAILTAWHFMMRSAEYCAKLAAGEFDLDRVVRIMDISFYVEGTKTLQYALADEVRVTFGKTKTTGGGEVRSHFACGHELCVVAALARLFMRRPVTDQKSPLFQWAEGSAKAGRGVRYYDVVHEVKAAAVECGYDAAVYASHSLRRGGATACLLAGMSIEATFGRWKGELCLCLYIETGTAFLIRRYSNRVVEGIEDADLLQRQLPRQRDVLFVRAKKSMQAAVEA